MTTGDARHRNILFLAYFFPPIQTIGVWRNYFLAREAKKYFAKVFVSGRRIDEGNRVDKVQFETFHYLSNPAPDYRFLLGRKQKPGFSEGSKQNVISKFLIRLVNSFPFNIFLGEGGIIYIVSSVWKAHCLIREENISHIYSSFRPMADHIVAWCLKSLHRKLIWTADFRDLPFDPLYTQYFWFGFQRWVLSGILRKADIVSTFHEGIGYGLREFSEKEITILENGPFQDFTKARNVEQNPIFTIQYTGSLFQDERNPAILMKALGELLEEKIISQEEIRLSYAGKDSAKWDSLAEQHRLSDVSVNHGLVSRERASVLQASAHLNLLLTSAHPAYKGILTGKFFEYIVAGRPILCIINGCRDQSVERLFDKYHLGMVVYLDEHNPGVLKDFLMKFLDDYRLNGKLNWQVDEKIYEEFNWQRTMEKWLEQLSSL